MVLSWLAKAAQKGNKAAQFFISMYSCCKTLDCFLVFHDVEDYLDPLIGM